MSVSAWIIGERASVGAALGSALDQTGIRFAARSPAEIEHISDREAADLPQIVFLAMDYLLPQHTSLLERLRRLGAAKIVVISAISHPKLMVEAIRAGADDFIDPTGDLLSELRGLIERLPGERQGNGAGRLLTVLPAADPSDASFAAANLAAAMAALSGCTLLDLNLKGGDLAVMFGVAPRHTVEQLLRQANQLDDGMLQQAMVAHDCGVRLLASPPPFSTVATADARHVRRLIDMSRVNGATVIANFADTALAVDAGVTTCSDAIVVTTRLDLPSLARMKQHVRFLEVKGAQRERMFVLAVGVGRKAEVPISEVQKMAPGLNLRESPDDPVGLMVSLNVGEPIVLRDPRSDVSRALRKLATELSGASTGNLAEERTSLFSFKRGKRIASPST